MQDTLGTPTHKRIPEKLYTKISDTIVAMRQSFNPILQQISLVVVGWERDFILLNGVELMFVGADVGSPGLHLRVGEEALFVVGKV